MSDFKTVTEAVIRMGEVWPDRTFVFQDLTGKETPWTFARISEETDRRGAALQALGLKKGDRLGIIIIEPQDFILTFLAAVRIGVLPVPMYPPLSFGSLDAYAEKTARVLDDAGATLLVASKRLENVLWGLVDKVPSLKKLVPVETLHDAQGKASPVEISPEDLCFLQYTSGSTSDPKGVMVTHANLVANCGAIVESIEVRPDEGDVCVCWLPLYHDMGLIGHVLTPVLQGVPSVYIPTMRFIKRPSCWLEAMHRHKGTASFGPNFAYALVTRRAKEAELDQWDLSHVKTFGCGAEPISAETMEAFIEKFSSRCGMKPEAVLPAYGMAEATLAMSFKPLRDPLVVQAVAAEPFQGEGLVQAPESDEDPVLVHVGCGHPMPGHDLAVFSPETGAPLPDRVEGELCFKGPSVTVGYWKNPTSTAAAFRGEWLRTGDLGYTDDGEIFVTGRLKDLLIINGRNIHPQTLEWEAAQVPGVRKGNVVAFSRPGASSEEVVLVLETTEDDTEALAEAVTTRIQAEQSLAVAEVVCVGRGTLPKTSSGKLQRRKTRQLYLTGELGRTGVRTVGAGGDRITLARHVARSLWTRAKTAVLSR